MSQLESIEELLYRLITAPSGVAEGLSREGLEPRDLDAAVIGDDRLSSAARVDIYANMYFYRLLDVMKEDFPGVLDAVGDANFHNLVTGYLIEYPPTGFSVQSVGRSFADYLRDHPIIAEFPFLAELASLERATIDVFLAVDTAALHAESMRAVDPARWAEVRMRLAPSAMLCEFDWRVADYLHALEQELKAETPQRERNLTLVWRKNNRAHFRVVETSETEPLKLLNAAPSFGEICESIAAHSDAENPTAEINRIVSRWFADTFLIRA
jgi:hypothetical protein